MNFLLKPEPFDEAVAKLAAKTPVASALRSKEWHEVHVQVSDRGQFTAGCEDIRVPSLIQSKLGDAVRLRREAVANGSAYVTRSSFIGDLRKTVYACGLSDRTGGITDLASRAREALIYNTQIESAFGFAQRKAGMDADALNGTPAQELIRSTARMPRAEWDWGERWAKACAEAGDGKAADVQLETGRLVALKTSGVWAALNEDFGVPWPPFAFGSKRLLRDVFREEAEELGLIAPADILQPDVSEQSFNTRLQADVSDLQPWALRQLREWFGDSIRIEGGIAEWIRRAAA